MASLNLQNHWWREGKVKPDLAKKFKLGAFEEAKKLVQTRQAIVISGMRRVGKSTTMMQLIQSLIERGVNPLNIVYFSFDESIENLLDLMKEYATTTGRDYEKEKTFLFLDEIQKLGDWANQVKLLYDSLPNLKIVISGSAAFPLERQSKTILAGRTFYMRIDPLSFKEFVEMKHGLKIRSGQLELWRDKLPPYFADYLKRPLPEMVEMSPGLLRRYIKESVVDRILYKDIPESYGAVDHEVLQDLFNILFENIGMYLNIDSLSRDLKRSKKTILKVLRYMKDSYLLRFVSNFRPSVMASSRKLRRVYPYHFCLVSNQEVEESVLMECVAASIFDASYYWRENTREVDFILDGKPVEVKWKDRFSVDDYKNMERFMGKYKVKRGFILTKSEHSPISFRRGSISLLPLWKAAFTKAL